MGERKEVGSVWRLPRWAAGLGVLLVIGCGHNPTQPDPPTPTAPTITCPAPIEALAHKNVLPTVTFDNPSPQGGQAPVAVSCSPASGAQFPLGDSMVTCTATDVASRTGTCDFTVTVDPVPQIARTKFMAFGDSLTAGQTSPAPTVLVLDVEDSYPTKLLVMLSDRYQDQTITMVNEGASGHLAENDYSRFQDAMRADRPEVVLLMEGANDLNTYGEASIPKIVGALEQMIGDARSRGAVVFLATLPPQNPDGKNGHHAGLLPELNTQIAMAAADEGATLVDLYGTLGTWVGYIGADGLHPTPEGYQRIAEVWQDAIEGRLETAGGGQTSVAGPRPTLALRRR
jgi:lysophospholipase L1-like esterase